MIIRIDYGRLVVGLAIVVSLCCAPAVQADLDEGLVAYWSFDDGTAHDDSGHGHDGVIHGAAVVLGVSGNALSFDGIDDYVEIPGTSAFQFANQSLTFCTWVTIVDNQDLYRAFIHLGSAVGENNYPAICLQKARSGWLDGRLYTQVWNGSEQATASSLADGDALPKNTWTHLAGVVDCEGSSVHLYLNGYLQDTAAAVTFDLSEAEELGLRLGASPWYGISGYKFHNGLLDEVRIYDRALSEDEIRQLMWDANPEISEDYLSGDQSDVSGSDGDPVNTGTGNFFHRQTDLSAPTRGGLMAFTRYYNSAAAAGAKERETEGMHATQDTKVAGSPANCGVERLGEQVAADIQLHEVSLAVFMVAVSGFGAVCWLVRRTLNIGMRASESQATPQHHLDSTRRAEG